MALPDTGMVEPATLRVRNKEIPVKTLWIEQSKLQFYGGPFASPPRLEMRTSAASIIS
jgi:hypothetical protein